jgi:hypothetical protein
MLGTALGLVYCVSPLSSLHHKNAHPFFACGFVPPLPQHRRRQLLLQHRRHPPRTPRQLLLDDDATTTIRGGALVLLMSKKENEHDDPQEGEQQPHKDDNELQQKASDSNRSMNNIPSSSLNKSSKENIKKVDPLLPGIKSVLQVALDLLENVYSVVILFLGVSVSCGLLLNLVGYGYQVNPSAITASLPWDQQQDVTVPVSSSSSPPPPPPQFLRIDTIARFREETQFQREIFNSMKEKRQRDDASASAASAATSATATAAAAAAAATAAAIAATE